MIFVINIGIYFSQAIMIGYILAVQISHGQESLWQDSID